jgi:DNA-3-methyladenine glycosylase
VGRLLRLGRDFFARPSPEVARDLIGTLFVHRTPEGRAGGIVVEVEAYEQTDPASHSYAGKTARNAVMFGRAGVLYVYFSYGVHWCANVVTGDPGYGSAVLLRALEPTVGVELMKRRRKMETVRDLCRGPGRLTQALAIDRSHDGADVVRGPFSFHAAPSRPVIAVGPRIGITKAADVPWRFCAKDSKFLSRRVK